MEQSGRRFTVLVDADNVSPRCIKYILDEVNDQGIATYEHIHDDWTDSEKYSWKNVLLDWSINPIQQCSYTTGKNATDSAMIIDAMDILYPGSVGGLCLVSSDSDFTKLTQRLRGARMFVMGIEGQKTPKPFRAVCGTFKLLEIISSDDAPKVTVIENQKTITSIDEIQEAITELLTESNSQNQPIILARVGNFLTRRFSNFGVRNYGYPKFSTSLESLSNNDLWVVKLHDGFFIQGRSVGTSKAEVEKVIAHVIRGSDGHVDSLSVVRDGLKKISSSSDVKRYGFGHISSFIRSFGSFKIRDNAVQMK